MGPSILILAAAAGSVSLAVCATLWAVAQRRAGDARAIALEGQIDQLRAGSQAARASAEAFDCALVVVDDGQAVLASGEEALAACLAAFDLDEGEVRTLIEAMISADADHARRLKVLMEKGEPCAFESRGTYGAVSVEGRAAGAQVWLRLTALSAGEAALPTAARLAAFLDAQGEAAWIASADGAVQWANSVWLEAVGAQDLADAVSRKLSFDPETEVLARESAEAGERRETVKRITVLGRRRAFRIRAMPLEGGDVALSARDLTESEDIREALKRHVAAHDETLNHIAEAVAIFSQNRKLSFHNAAFAELWALEPAWLADHPTHGEILDRLRQRRRLPETADYAGWKAAELARYESLGPHPDDLWSLPDGRTLRVVHQPHPLGGALLLFSDITDELKLKARYNAFIQVQQATLDKLNDAVAVFGADGRLRLHNEAFAGFWNIAPADLDGPVDFEGVVARCLPRLHDQIFWTELKGRIADPDPKSRAPASGEVRTSDRRIVSWQSRPLPDGATLIAFADITDTRRLESALADRESALAEAERLKREFVGNVSYELRTPLTTIIGYSEILERMGDALPERARGHLAAVRSAGAQLGRSIDDVLDIAAIDAGEMALDVADIRVGELLSETRTRWADRFEASQLSLILDCDPEAGLIRGDARRFAQVLDHLVENGLRQTPAGGSVTLSARRAPGEVMLAVADTGRGIPFHVQAHIFDRFVGRDRGGPGLGLALVKCLVELHGGWVALESEPGNGAVFTCHLPETSQVQGDQRELGL
ncbi:MAG: PAS-domain containing protein [Caulobacter sp.]|nr:PAS-domain containing protein [Caulobacter sp.]